MSRGTEYAKVSYCLFAVCGPLTLEKSVVQAEAGHLCGKAAGSGLAGHELGRMESGNHQGGEVSAE